MKQRIFNTIVFFLIFTTSFFTAKAGDCEKPKNLKAESISATEVRLSWTAMADATAFRVRVEEGDDNDHDFDLEKIVSGNAFIVSGLHAGEQYEFRIRTICGDDHSNWVDDFIFYTSGVNDPNNPPSGSSCGIPNGLVITNISDSSATVSWNRVPGVNTYELEVEDGENTPAFNFNFNIVTGDTAVVVTGLNANGQYKAKVKSKCSGGNSDYSGIVLFNATSGSSGGGNPPVDSSCGIPSGLVITDITDSTAIVRWNRVPGANNYELEVEDGENTPLFNFNVVTGDTSFMVIGLNANGQYKAKVKSKCSGGNNSDYSDWLFFNAATGSPAGNPPSNTSCTIPTGLTISGISDSSATVSWNRVPGVNTYELEVEDGENTPAFAFNIVTGDTVVVVTGLVANGQYKAKVKSKCSGEDSGYSGLVFFKALMGPGLINVPSETTPIGKTVVAMEVFPNPAREEVKIRFYNNPQISETVYRIELRDLTGSLKKALTQPLMEDNLVRFPLHDLEPGLYILTKYSNKGRASVKVMVQ